MRQLQISGEVLTDKTSIDRYSSDMSHYKVKPSMIAIPTNQQDLAEIIAYAKEEAVPITPRGAGSNQSGSAVGSGVIVLFSKMNTIIRKEGQRVEVQPGIIHQQLDRQLNLAGLRIPYDPSSRSFCTIGGNVATKASGMRSLKYGTVDSALKSLSFFDSTHGLVDTAKSLPENLEQAIIHLKNQLRSDEEATNTLKARGDLKSSSGYNLKSFYTYDEPAEIVTHLLAGSVGTLGIFTKIELEAIPLSKSIILYVLFFHSLMDALSDLPKLKSFNPSAIEVMDSHGVDLIKESNQIGVPPDCKAVLYVEFDTNADQTNDLIQRHCNEKALKFSTETNTKKQAALWKIRESMLLWIMSSLETEDKKFPPFADDIAVPLDRLPNFVENVQQILNSFGTIAVIYGHAGEGNIHIRPMISKYNWEENLRKLSSLIFEAALKEGGTITGEHGLGRNRSKYLPNEWGTRIYGYFIEIKKIFDPTNILNPGIVFTKDDLTKNLEL